MPAPSSNTSCPWAATALSLRGLGMGVMNCAGRRVSMIRYVGCPSASSSQWCAGYSYGELRIGCSKKRLSITDREKETEKTAWVLTVSAKHGLRREPRLAGSWANDTDAHGFALLPGFHRAARSLRITHEGNFCRQLRIRQAKREVRMDSVEVRRKVVPHTRGSFSPDIDR